MKVPNPRTVAMYRRLLKSMMRVFKGDYEAFHRIRIQARKEILKNSEITTQAELNQKLFEAEEARNLLLTQLMQGVLQDEGHYRWVVRREHAMGANPKPPSPS